MGRHDKIREAIKQEVSSILHDELKDPRLGFTTITDVELSGDMRHAKVFFSVLGQEEDYKNTQQALDSALGFIRRQIAERINLRLAPEIIFRQDRSSEYSIKIQEVLDEIKTLAGPHKDKPAKVRKERKLEPKKSRKAHKKK